MKTVFITGASSGIGQACAIRFAKEGYRLIINGRRSDKLEALEKQIRQDYKVETFKLVFDVKKREEVIKGIASLPKEWSKIDILINNAGLAAGLDPIQEGSEMDWEQMIDTNVKGLLFVSQAVIPGMIENKSGHIINIGSIAGKEVYPKGNVYCASKHAVDALTKGMRMDLLPYGIKVSQIAPGAVETEFSIVRFKGDSERAKKVYEGFTPLRGEDIADACFYIASLPGHVNINDIVIMPTAQASASITYRNN